MLILMKGNGDFKNIKWVCDENMGIKQKGIFKKFIFKIHK